MNEFNYDLLKNYVVTEDPGSIEVKPRKKYDKNAPRMAERDAQIVSLREKKTPTKVIEYRVGLARNNAQGRWDVERWSDALTAGFTMNPGDTRQLPSATALIPVDNLLSLKDTWLVVQVKVQRDGTVGTTYAHSQKLTLE